MTALKKASNLLCRARRSPLVWVSRKRKLSRLKSASMGTSSWSFAYDANGNRSTASINATASSYTTPSTSNRLSATTNPARAITYDAAGNPSAVTGAAPSSFSATYNLAGRQVTLIKSGVTTTYAYDSEGRRIRKFISAGTGAGAASTVVFAYDQNDQLLGEYDASGKAIREYVWLGNRPVAVFTPDTKATTPAAVATNPPLVYYIHTDHLNTPRVVMDRANKLRWRWMAEPFGTTAPETNPSALGSFTLPLRFPGQYADAESGLFYNHHRSYDPALGRYTQSDPIGLLGGINTYSYVTGNPVSFIDPRGLNADPPGTYDIIQPSPTRIDSLPHGAGCGDASSDYWIPDPFMKSCQAHDKCYENQCGKSTCDTKFYDDMKKEKPNLPRAIPWIYYKAVDLFGGSAYRNAGKGR